IRSAADAGEVRRAAKPIAIRERFPYISNLSLRFRSPWGNRRAHLGGAVKPTTVGPTRGLSQPKNGFFRANHLHTGEANGLKEARKARRIALSTSLAPAVHRQELSVRLWHRHRPARRHPLVRGPACLGRGRAGPPCRGAV